jgi:Ni,Fe-hydrogenase I large subunit
MDGRINQLTVDVPGYAYKAKLVSATAYGLTEVPCGALGHWITITANPIVTDFSLRAS